MKYKCLQLNDYDCGFACIKMLLANVFNNRNYLYLEQDSKKENYSFKELKDIANLHNLEIDGYEILDLKNVNKFPLIALISVNNINHYVIIHHLNQKYIYFFDPQRGEMKLEIEEFDFISLKKYLVVEKVNKNEKYQFKLFKEKRYTLLQSLFLFLELISLFMISFCVEKFDIKILIFFLAFLIGIIGNYTLNIYCMKKYDEEVIYPLLKRFPKFLDDYLSKSLENEYLLKRDMFSSINNKFIAGTSLGLITFILLINDIRHFIILGILLIFVMVKKKVLKEINIPIKNKIYTLENALSFNMDNFAYADKLAYKYAENEHIFTLFSIIIVALYSLVICLIDENFYQLIYLSLSSYFIVNKLNEILNFEDYNLALDKKINIHNTLNNYLNNQ